MQDIPDVRQLRQDLADNTAAQARLKAKLLEFAALTAPNNKQLEQWNAAEAAYDAAVKAAVPLAEKLRVAEKFLEEEKKQGHPPDGREIVRDILRPSGAKWDYFEQFNASRGDYGDHADKAAYFHALGYQLMASTTMNRTSGPHGANVVPPAVAGPIFNEGIEKSFVASRAQVWAVPGESRVVPAWDYTDRSEGRISGLKIVWTPEEGEMSPQTALLRKIKHVPKKATILLVASNELLEDGADFQQQIEPQIAAVTPYGLDDVFMNGTGSGQPLGILNSPARVVVSKENGQSAATLVWKNLVKMYARLCTASIERSVWVIHSSAIPQLMTMSVEVGDGGTWIPAMPSANGAFSILNRPVIFSERVPPLGTEGDVGLYDFGMYSIGLRNEMRIDRSEHVFFTSDKMTFRMRIRVDGQPVISEPYAMPNGAPTTSPFVTLQTRS